MSFQTEIKPYKFHLSAVTNNDDDVIIYAEALQNITQRINTFNRHTGKRITAKTIYESVWAKVFAVIAVVLLICAPLINLFTVRNTGSLGGNMRLLCLLQFHWFTKFTIKTEGSNSTC